MAARSTGSTLTYQCGPARRFLDPETGLHYDTRIMECNWNQVGKNFAISFINIDQVGTNGCIYNLSHVLMVLTSFLTQISNKACLKTL